VIVDGIDHDCGVCRWRERADVTLGLWKGGGTLTIWIGDLNVPAYNSFMEISLAPEVEAKLTRIASEAGKAANQLVQELVADYLGHDEWFKREVQKGLARKDCDDGRERGFRQLA